MMRILMVTSEAVPFVKTGGLADVCGALPRALADLGHDVRIVLPRYKQIKDLQLEEFPQPLGVPTGAKERWCGVLTTTLPNSEVPVYFIENDELFDRDGLYGPNGGESYPDNCLRFTVLCRGALQLCHALGWFPEIFHCHDWQAALVPAMLRTFESDSELSKSATLLTIHNLAYQGRGSADDMTVTGLGWELFNWQNFEFYNDTNLLKGGIALASLINTVSPTYAKEIRTPEFGEGLHDLLQYRSDRVRGVLNGIDSELWNPETDQLIPATYSSENRSGKKLCRKALQRRAVLPPDDNAIIAGFIGRLADQKGIELLINAIPGMRELGVQLVVLGTGTKSREEELRKISKQHADVCVWIDFDEELAHLIQAGCDLLLMPSLYEPCGLNQLYAMRYGTLPVVTNIGGLSDSVVDYDEEQATGFKLRDISSESLVEAVRRAAMCCRNEPQRFETIIDRAMAQDFRWHLSARRYVELYSEALD